MGIPLTVMASAGTPQYSSEAVPSGLATKETAPQMSF
jgi:hypothetical protein